jgi:alpha-glucosidase
MQPGVTARSVYLPKGTWYDWHSDEKHTGESYVTAQAPLNRIPLFARGGSIIACHAQALTSTAEHQTSELELHLFVPNEDGEFRSTLHEDDGTTKQHEQGAFWRTTFTTTRRGNELRVRAAVTGQGYPEHQRRSFTLVVHGSVQEIAINGHQLQATQGRVKFDNQGAAFDVLAKVS